MKSGGRKKIEKIAVVGMAGVFPSAQNTTRFFDNILEKKSSIIRVPEDRWIKPVKNFISPSAVPDKAICDKAGCVHSFDFDPHGFQIDPDLLSCLDPVHQLVLKAGRDAYFQCRHTSEDTKRTGVILAAIALPTQATSLFSNQVLFGKNLTMFDPKDVLRNGVVSWPASILARAMGFNAGSYTLDAACASSLFSIKLACEHLTLKKADIMIAGGVSRPDSLYTQIGFTQLQALSPSGRCAPFDASADGLIVGEGAGIVVLKRLEDAVQCKDKIHAVISGTGASNDIEGTLVGPASEGQVRAMNFAYEQALWSPDDIQYMECHGSGTSVGDQVELTSIKRLLDRYHCPDTSLSIGSVKSMIGHLLTAAGAAGFIKTVMAMEQGVLPPSLNFSSPSANSPLNQSNIKVQTHVEEWKPQSTEVTRKAGVSAFGFGGINAHLLIEEFEPDSRAFPVSSQTAASTGKKEKTSEFKIVPCAVIGMECITKECDTLESFKELLFSNKKITPDLPGLRWKRNLSEFYATPGFYLEELKVELGKFHIQPNQMNDILVQHLYLLTAAYSSMTDAGIEPRPDANSSQRDNIGCAIGIDFDFGATDFNSRWQIHSLEDKIKSAVSPSLTFNRTLGALGGIVASRIAREFKLGGPCFTLSAGEASGIKAIEAGIHSLSAYETDTFICGCVDLAGDVRASILNSLGRKSDCNEIPSEGAAAIVLKRYDQALEDGDSIYAVVSGTGGSGGDLLPGESHYSSKISNDIFEMSLKSALDNSKVKLTDIDLCEISSGSKSDYSQTGIPELLSQISNAAPFIFSSVSTVVGKTGTVSSLFSVIQCALSLKYAQLPQNALVEAHGNTKRQSKWVQSDMQAPKRAMVCSSATDGAFSHLIMEKHLDFASKLRKKSEKAQITEENKPKLTHKNIILRTNPRPLPDDTINNIQNFLGLTDQEITVQENKLTKQLIDPDLIAQGTEATARAHEKFLKFSSAGMQKFEIQFKSLAQLATKVVNSSDSLIPADDDEPVVHVTKPYLDRDQCVEFAVGKAGDVLGPEFDIIDTYPVRVRLPAEPLMLVDRILEIKGEMLSLGKGKIITQHDVKEDAWYLDGPKTPVSISIEAGQADLFLCSWLGIDHKVKGKRKYRLLDAKVTFHRTLPQAGETIEYHIEIDRFLKQGEIYLFFFHYNGYIGDELFISMRDGCAGFFTEQEVENSGGIILKSEERKKVVLSSEFKPFVKIKKQAFSDDQIQALRKGNLEKAFGVQFSGKTLGPNLRLPGGRMHLIDRVLEFNPFGGRFGLGSITAQSDIHPDAWFLTCHFIDDMVMPGTLMYECCAHALRVFTMRIGWVSDRADVFYDVLPHNEADLKCRGPVTPQTAHARYEIEIKEIGYGPEPYIIADANMFSDDLRIVLYKNMGLKLVGMSEEELKGLWR